MKTITILQILALLLVPQLIVLGQTFPLKEPYHYTRSFTQERGLALLNQEVASNPNSVDILLKRAKFKLLQGMDEAALQDIETAHQMNPYATSLYGLNGPYGIIEIIEYQPEEAFVKSEDSEHQLSSYFDWVKKDTSSQMNQNELDALLTCIMAIEENKYDLALKTVDEILDIHPISVLVLDLKGLILFKMDKMEEASVYLKEATLVEPSYPLAWYNLSKIEKEKGNVEKSKIYLDKALQLQDDLTFVYFDRALLLKEMGDRQRAIENYDQVLDNTKKENWEVFANRGLTKKMEGDFTGALQDLNSAIEINENDAQLYKNRGNLYLLFGQHQKAVENYQQAILIAEDYAEAYYNLALTQYLLGDQSDACQNLAMALELGLQRAEEKQAYFCRD